MRAEAFAASAEILIGAPFRLHGRSPELGLDCAGLVHHALTSAGERPAPLPPYNLRNASYDFVPRFAESCGFEPVSQIILRGDLLAVRPGPAQLHLLIATASSKFIHAHAGLRRVVTMNALADWPILYHFRLAEKK